MKEKAVTGTPNYMKQLNKQIILKYICDEQPVSRSQIAEHTNISRATVSQAIDELIGEGWVSECGVGSASEHGGRKPIQLTFNANAAYVLSIDVGGTNTVLALCNLRGEIKRVLTLPSTEEGVPPLETLNTNIRTLLASLTAEEQNILGIGIGTPGVTDYLSGVVVDAPSLNWLNLPLRKQIESTFRLPTYIENDVNLAAMGEHWRGAGRNCQHLLMVSLGTGVGAGLIINGKVFRGATNFAGEIGFTVTDLNRVSNWASPIFRGYGFLESLVGGPGIVHQTKERLSHTDCRSSLRKISPDALTAKDVFDAYRNGDALARDILDETLTHLGIALANSISLFNPDAVVLGGGISRSADIIIPHVTQTVRKFSPSTPYICASQLGDHAGVIGGVALVLQEHDSVLQGIM